MGSVILNMWVISWKVVMRMFQGLTAFLRPKSNPTDYTDARQHCQYGKRHRWPGNCDQPTCQRVGHQPTRMGKCELGGVNGGSVFRVC